MKKKPIVKTLEEIRKQWNQENDYFDYFAENDFCTCSECVYFRIYKKFPYQGECIRLCKTMIDAKVQYPTKYDYSVSLAGVCSRFMGIDGGGLDPGAEYEIPERKKGVKAV